MEAAFGSALLDLIFANLDLADIGDAAGLQASATAGSLYVALHTADPAGGADQSANEATYTGYARVAVARSATAWTVAGLTASTAAAVTFDECTAGSETITHYSVGLESAGATQMIDSAALDTSLAVSAGVIPEFAAGEVSLVLS